MVYLYIYMLISNETVLSIYAKPRDPSVECRIFNCLTHISRDMSLKVEGHL